MFHISVVLCCLLAGLQSHVVRGATQTQMVYSVNFFDMLATTTAGYINNITLETYQEYLGVYFQSPPQLWLLYNHTGEPSNAQVFPNAAFGNNYFAVSTSPSITSSSYTFFPITGYNVISTYYISWTSNCQTSFCIASYGITYTLKVTASFTESVVTLGFLIVACSPSCSVMPSLALWDFYMYGPILNCSVGTYAAENDCYYCSGGSWSNQVGTVGCAGQCNAGCACPQGSTNACPTTCVTGQACPAGTGTAYTCQPGQACPSITQGSVYCVAGYYQPTSGQTSCLPAPAGYYSVYSGASTVSACPPGSYGLGASTSALCSGLCADGCECGSASATACPTACPAGSYCQGGNVTPCPSGSYCPQSSIAPVQCPAGEYSPSPGAGQCLSCPSGAYCLAGAVAPTLCPSSTHQDTEAATSSDSCIHSNLCVCTNYAPIIVLTIAGAISLVMFFYYTRDFLLTGQMALNVADVLSNVAYVLLSTFYSQAYLDATVIFLLLSTAPSVLVTLLSNHHYALPKLRGKRHLGLHVIESNELWKQAWIGLAWLLLITVNLVWLSAFALVGVMALLSRILTVDAVLGFWLTIWSGKDYQSGQQGSPTTAQAGASPINRKTFHQLFLIRLLLENIPQIIVQSLNNSKLNNWDTLAIVSTVFSVIFLLSNLYRYCYYLGWKRMPLNEIPLKISGFDEFTALPSPAGQKRAHAIQEMGFCPWLIYTCSGQGDASSSLDSPSKPQPPPVPARPVSVPMMSLAPSSSSSSKALDDSDYSGPSSPAFSLMTPSHFPPPPPYSPSQHYSPPYSTMDQPQAVSTSVDPYASHSAVPTPTGDVVNSSAAGAAPHSQPSSQPRPTPGHVDPYTDPYA